MSFEYGSRQIEIGNPFKLEGIFYALRGALIAILGGILIFSVRETVTADASLIGWLQFGTGIALLSLGLAAVGLGALKMFRFYVGRGAPSDLARHENTYGSTAYTAKSLADMLLARKNLTYIEPMGLVGRGIHSVFQRLIFTPLPIRIVTQRIFEGALYSILALLIYGLALFSGSTGLTNITDTPVQGWLGVALTAFLFGIWYMKIPQRGDLAAGGVRATKTRNLTGVIVGAIALPTILGQVHAWKPLPEPPADTGFWLWMLVGMAVATSVLAGFLAAFRIWKHEPLTEVSEYRDHWQESLHPMDIYRSFDMVMADHRHLEIPNRVYAQIDPGLLMQGSADKGKFAGATVQETQPVPIGGKAPSTMRHLALATSFLGNVLIAISATLIFLQVKGATLPLDYAAFAAALVMPTILWLFGRIITRLANTFLAEIQFISRMVYFFAEGTYTESKLSTGMSIYDSNRSENTVVRSSLTPWMLVSHVRSSTFAVSGSDNLEQYRYVLELEKDDAFLATLRDDLRRYMDSRQQIADFKSESDMDAASVIHQMNDATRAQPGPDTGKGLKGRKLEALPQDVRPAADTSTSLDGPANDMLPGSSSGDGGEGRG
ncbi:MAG: hypothetical protein Alpg2KO_13650 [Alphaproteobacteria bacterium]